MASCSLRLGFATPTLNFNRYQERVNLYGLQIWPMHSQGPSERQPREKKGAWAYPGTAHFLDTPTLSQERKFCTHIHRIDRNKDPLKISGNVDVGVLRGSRKFSGHLYIGHIVRSSLR